MRASFLAKGVIENFSAVPRFFSPFSSFVLFCLFCLFF